MPTYEYRCETCGVFEAVHGMKDPSLAACPTCGKPVTRLISKGGGLIFKGTGFYITDYRSADYKEKAEKDSGAAKPAAETAAKPGAKDPGTAPAPASTPAPSPAAPAAPPSSSSTSTSSTSTSGGGTST